MLRAWAGSPLTTRSPKRISPASGWWKPATRRRRVVLPQPDGPSRVNSSPSATVRSARSTAVTAPNRFTPPSARLIPRGGSGARLLLLQLVPLRLDGGAKLGLGRLCPLGGPVLVVDVAHPALEVRAPPAGELDGHLRGRARGALDLV